LDQKVLQEKIWRINLLGYRSIPYRFIWQQRPTSCPKFINLQIQQVDKAIENAKDNLGFTNGAALYPMVTMNGEECHNEWEITHEEIHRNGALFLLF
jgi:trehalose/maltose hydrolase-like predicted phosphorylase